VSDTLVGVVVKIDEVLFPIRRKELSVDSITVILRGDVGLASGQIDDGLVVTSVTVRKLVSLGAGSETEDLVTHANTHDGDGVVLSHFSSEVFNGNGHESGITGSVGKHDTVILLFAERMVPRNDEEGDTSVEEASDDVVLDTEIDEDNSERSSFEVNGGLDGDFRNEVSGVGIFVRKLGFIVTFVDELTEG